MFPYHRRMISCRSFVGLFPVLSRFVPCSGWRIYYCGPEKDSRTIHHNIRNENIPKSFPVLFFNPRIQANKIIIENRQKSFRTHKWIIMAAGKHRSIGRNDLWPIFHFVACRTFISPHEEVVTGMRMFVYSFLQQKTTNLNSIVIAFH